MSKKFEEEIKEEFRKVSEEGEEEVDTIITKTSHSLTESTNTLWIVLGIFAAVAVLAIWYALG